MLPDKWEQVVFQILSRCTLNCKLCLSFHPAYDKLNRHFIEPLEEIRLSVDALFSFVTKTNDITISGGEPLLHPDLPEIAEYILKYKAQFNTLRIYTNGSLKPKPELLRVLRDNAGRVLVVFDNYGADLSVNGEALKAALKEASIPMRENIYYGENQHFGGWISLGDLSKFRNHSEEELDYTFRHCFSGQAGIVALLKGKLYLDCPSAFAYDLGYCEPYPGEVLDLRKEQTKEEVYAILEEWGKKPLSACRYCSGRLQETAKRYPAGEQV